MTTLTKAAFLEKAQAKIELVKDVPEFGDVWVRAQKPVTRSIRLSRMFNDNGKRIEKEVGRRKLYEIIDQICTDKEGTPMFADSDLETLEGLDDRKLDPIYAVLQAFNGEAEKNGQAGSTDSKES